MFKPVLDSFGRCSELQNFAYIAVSNCIRQFLHKVGFAAIHDSCIDSFYYLSVLHRQQWSFFPATLTAMVNTSKFKRQLGSLRPIASAAFLVIPNCIYCFGRYFKFIVSVGRYSKVHPQLRSLFPNASTALVSFFNFIDSFRRYAQLH